jgi:hypothetical protein
MENNVESELHDFVEQIETWLTVTEDARYASERNRDYKDHKQWTADERATIEKRWQAAVTVNRVHPKVEGLKGLLIQRKTDPKAYARTPKHEKAAQAVTDALRYVSDNNKLDKTKLEVAENVFVEGYGAAITDVVYRGDEPEIITTPIPWDRYYYDYNSRRLDFSDKRWDGIVLWMDEDVVKETFDVKDEDISELYTDSGSFSGGFETFDDRPRWFDTQEKRIRICQHYYIKDGQWHLCYFTKNKMLMKPELVAYVDEFGEPINPIESVAAYLDRDNNRFGEVTYWLDLQDEINHRRSKFLFLLSQRQTMSKRGAVQDIPAMKRELAKPDGHVEYDGEKGDWDVIPTSDMAQGQFTLLEEAKAELDNVGYGGNLNGKDLSNRAMMNLQQTDVNELSSLFENILDWENRIYRQYWYRIKQFWTGEKWLRIIDDATKLRWVGLNQEVPLKTVLEERINDESLSMPQRNAAFDKLNMMMQAQDPQLNKVVEVRNEIPTIDVDVLIETSYDLVNIQREQFDMLFKLAQVRPEVPFTELLRMSELRNKDVLIKNIEQAQNAQSQATQQAQQVEQQLESVKVQSEAELKAAKTRREMEESRKRNVEATQTEVQTELMIEQGVKDPAVVI